MKTILNGKLSEFARKINQSITRKILCLIVMSIGASFLVSLFVIKKIENSYSNYVYETKTDLLNSSMAGIEDKMLVYENSTYQFITSSLVQQFASQLREAYETIDQVEEIMDRGEDLEDVPAIQAKKSRAVQMLTDSLVEILNQLDTFLASAHKTDAGYFVDQTNKLYKGYGASKYVFPEEELARVLDGAAQKRGSAYYSVVEMQTVSGEHKKEIVIARIVREKKNLSMRYCGTVIYLVAPEKLAASFLMEHDDLVIVDADKNVIFSSLNEDKQADFFGKMHQGGKKYEMMDLNGEKYFVTSLASPKLGWQYYNISDYYRLFAFIHNLDILYSLVLLAILVVIGIIASHFSVSLVKPIVKLSSQIESIKKNDDPVRALSEEGRKKIKKRDDEIGRLELEFASMTRQLGELIHENYEQKIYLQNAQLSALRSKLTPHFLYNTLDTIRWMATEEKYRQIPGVVKALGDILRISINSNEALIAVEQELEYMRGYLMIQRARFGERLNVRIEAAEELMKAKIPAFSVQPLGENAVNYALEQMENTCQIQVVIREEDGDILCSVADNGGGIDPQILDKLKLGTIRAQGNGVGLTNLDERLKSLYGPGYGIQVENSPAGGALIRFRVKKEVSGT